ncbi:MAG: tyrosine-type recombinase/integrase [Chloroflexota bacterium]|nr:tyrosine-type recombinase/integrase [Chloroflexota bacterium]
MKLIDAMKGYLLSRKVQGCTEKTMSWYRQKLLHFCDYMEVEYDITTLQKVTINHLRLFVDCLQRTKAGENNPHNHARMDANLSDLTVKGYVQVIKGFFTWCVSEEPPLLRKNPAASLKMPKVAKYLIKTLESHHVEALFAVCDISTSLGFRDYLILWLFLDTGIRLSELCSLTLDRVFIRLNNDPYIKIMGKGRKEREVGLHDTTAELLWKYIYHYRHPHNASEKAVFINRYGQPLTPTGVGQIILDMKKRAGIEGIRVSPHTLRHTFARTYLSRGGEIAKLSRLLGHGKVSTTEWYLHDFNSREARVDQSNFSPVAEFKMKKSHRGFQRRIRPELD